MAWDLSCKDWETRLMTGRSLVPDLPLDLVVGNRAVAIFDKLRLADVPGTPTMAEAGGDWFRAIVRALFGSLNPATRERMIRELFLLIPKKNSKTTNGALLMLTALLLNERPNATMIMTAPVQDVAEIAFKAVAGAIRLDDVLEKKLHVREHLKTIVHRETKAELQIMSFDPAALTGQKINAVLIDELHVVAKMSKAASAIRQLRGGMLPFPEAFMAFITTQSEDPPSGIFGAELTKARDIRDGKRQGAMLPVLYEFPPAVQKKKDAWRDSAIWKLVTPNEGKSIGIPRLIEEMQTAQDTSEEELRAWASQHLNIEIGLALSSDHWVGAEYWEDQIRPKLTLEQLIDQCEVIDIGIDGGGLQDMLGFAAVGRHKVTREWLSWTHAWLHRKVLEVRKADAPKFLDFEKDGDLTIYDKVGKDLEELAGYAEKIHLSGKLDKVGVDPVGLGGIIDALVSAGIPLEIILGITQGYKLSGTIQTTERKLAERVLWHGGQRLMNYCVGNARTVRTGNALIITKEASGVGKIDPLLATFNAINLISLNPAAPQKPKFQMFTIG